MAVRKTVDLGRGNRARAATTAPVGSQAGPRASGQQGSALGQGCGVVLVIVFVLFLIGRCSSDTTLAPGNSAAAAMSEPAYVAARSLNCRREPDASAAVAEGLARDEQVVVAERRDDWARLTRVGGDCWVSNSFLRTAPSGGAATAPPAPRSAQGLMSSGTTAAVATAGAGHVTAKAFRSSRRHASSRRRGASRSRRSSGGGYSGSGCPCSGSQICIGPRGGRYCITSGGNKRYGV